MKTYVIALTTWKEMVRRPMFWLLALVTSVLLLLFAYIPYYTMGEDLKMVKDQGLVAIMVTGLILALFAASVSIADEIDGKTAITLLSKPVSRRSFIVGKYLGIMAAVLALFVILTLVFAGSLVITLFQQNKDTSVPEPVFADMVKVWVSTLPGVVLAFLEVAILCSISVAFSTRFPLHLNITAIIAIFIVGHLAPMMVDANLGSQMELVRFVAKIFETVFPSLQFFNIGPAIATEATVPWLTYVLPCLLYTTLYAMIALSVALLMFEDRDLA